MGLKIFVSIGNMHTGHKTVSLLSNPLCPWAQRSQTSLMSHQDEEPGPQAFRLRAHCPERTGAMSPPSSQLCCYATRIDPISLKSHALHLLFGFYFYLLPGKFIFTIIFVFLRHFISLSTLWVLLTYRNAHTSSILGENSNYILKHMITNSALESPPCHFSFIAILFTSSVEAHSSFPLLQACTDYFK